MKDVKCVIFDLGGVLIESPTTAVLQYEQECNLPKYSVIKAMEYGNDDGLTARFERSQLSFQQYCQSMEQQMRTIDKFTGFSGAQLVYRMETSCKLRQRVIDAIDVIRSHGVTCAVITNNWYSIPEHSTTTTDQTPLTDEHLYQQLKSHFDVFIESRVCGIRKPSSQIYDLCLKECERVRGHAMSPETVVFFDDIGRNLKPMKDMGVNTVKVESEQQLLFALQSLFRFPLLTTHPQPDQPRAN